MNPKTVLFLRHSGGTATSLIDHLLDALRQGRREHAREYARHIILTTIDLPKSMVDDIYRCAIAR